MLPRDPLSLAQVARLAATSPVFPVGDPRQQAFQRALASQLGQTLQADVLARLPDGSFIVRVADQAARMPLPPGAQPGTQLPLTLIALQPRPTFQIGSGAGSLVFAEAAPAAPEGAVPGHAANPPAPGAAGAPLAYLDGKEAAALANDAARSGPARMAAGGPFSPAGPEGASAHLSPGGQTIARVLAAAADAAQPATAAVARTPLLNAPSENAGHLAAALRQGLEQSGLFYESHVAEWAQGLRARADLAAEPQGRGAMPSALAPDAAQFINLQLGVQEQGRIAWQGPLWPGQDLRWDIERHPARAGDDDDAGRGGAAAGADGTQWHSRLRLRFAGLGDVDAHLVLAGDRLHLRLDAGEDAAARMHAASSLLATALDAAGTPLASLAIHSAPGEPAAEPDGQG